MTGPIVNSAALVVGGLVGGLFGKYLPERCKNTLPLIFGVIVTGIGASLVGKAAYFPVVVAALILGTFMGELFYLEKGLELAIRKSLQWSKKHDRPVDDNFIINFVTLFSAFCFGSMGIFGAMREGITGDPTILYTKAVLDFFCGMVFGSSMGARVSYIAVPQFILLVIIFFAGKLFFPLISETMFADFTAVGGIIFLATGLRMCGIKIFPLINMLPSLLLVFPLSWLWWRLLG